MILSGKRDVTIAVRPAVDHPARKITKIVGLGGSGFSVLVPYHKAQNGFLFKMPVGPSVHTPGPHDIRSVDFVSFTADDRVKLSYHTDGFAQFSGERPGRITSGRDPKTGVPKGLGLMTHPLTSPIWSGPSVAVTAWGLDEFEEIEDGDRPHILFEPQELYYRGCAPDEANAWMISIYAFPINVVPPVRFVQGSAVIDVTVAPLSGPLASVVQMKIIYLRKEKVFLGLYVNRLIASFRSKSGWQLSGPGDFTLNKEGHVLGAVYPRDGVSKDGKVSLDRKQLPML